MTKIMYQICQENKTKFKNVLHYVTNICPQHGLTKVITLDSLKQRTCRMNL